ncbi:TetR/AcrR family transcriptional regulator [Clostridium sp. 19966]|uniref:TetR/AcrR family transcriptional regulator n=1 Tax=Clostridium sp. 19966 TaxID=2768166 RepID=UPI0028DE4FB7|nr:TetR/AcrR family transcriptional regulator [Clostridium sp. 19966]MDT8717765.1 TetR/AcrR family transcriptional regulator [Clostridium sp. 19966]
MQYLKDEVKDKILKAAVLEFKENGYMDCSIRKIAERAHITSGNIYRYFSNKEALFDAIVAPVYGEFMEYILNIKSELKSCSYMKKAEVLEYIQKINNTFPRLFEEYGNELKILLNKSKGSKYSNVKEELIEVIDDLLKENIAKEYLEAEDSITYVLASTLVEGMCIILKQYEDTEKIKVVFDKFIVIYSLGINESLSKK